MAVWRWAGVAVALALAAAGARAAETLAQQREAAIKLIEEAAASICQTVPTSQTSSGYELSGKAQAEVKGLAAKVANLGLSGAAKYGKGESSGVLQKDLANAIQQSNSCKLTVFQTLAASMLPKAPAPAPARASSPKPKTAAADKPAAVAQAAPPPPPKPQDSRSAESHPSPLAQAPTYEPRAAAPPSASVQFYPTSTVAPDNTNIEVFPCLQAERSVTCTIYVTAGPRGGRWMADRKSGVLDENGATIAPSLVTIGALNHDPTQGGKIVDLSPGARTRVLYRFDNIADATKLQALNITVCCIRNLTFHRQ